jgi:hypothetical protein
MVPNVPGAALWNAAGFSHCAEERFGMKGSSSTWFAR